MIVVTPSAMRADFLFTMRQNIQYDQTLMVPALFCEDVSQAQKKLTCENTGLIRSHWLLNYRRRDAVQLTLMVHWLLTKNLYQ
jgi:hypothetical protein